MDREDFLFALREQYAEEIQEAYLQCEHEEGKVIDYSALKGLLMKMMKTARVDGLPSEDFSDLVRSTLPDAVVEKVEIFSTQKQAA